MLVWSSYARVEDMLSLGSIASRPRWLALSFCLFTIYGRMYRVMEAGIVKSK